MHSEITGNYILQSLPPQGLDEAFPSLSPSDDSHERSRETGRKCGALGPLNVLTRKHYPLCVCSSAQVLCLVITASKLCGPFNERRDISLRPFYNLRRRRQRTDYLQAFLLSLTIFPLWRRHVNSWEYRSEPAKFFPASASRQKFS